MKTLFQSMDRLEQAMDFHRERHAVLAGNVANVDTPGYHPYDLTRRDGASSAIALDVTNARHLNGQEEGDVELLFDSAGLTSGADGNAVNLDQELAKIDANRTRYTTSAELLSRRAALLRYASTDGN